MKLPRFTLQTLFVAVTLIAVFLGWRLWELRERQQLICEQCVAAKIASLHWQRAGDPLTKKLDASLSSSLSSPTACSLTLLLPSGKFKDGSDADDFEKGIIAEWSKASTLGGIAVNETTTRGAFSGPFTFYKAIRAMDQSCLSCHHELVNGHFPPAPPIQVGGIIAIAKVELSK